MSYLKYTMYIYLLAAIFFAYKAVATWNDDTDLHWLFVMITVMALLMFFVRRKFANRFNGGPKQ